MLKPTKKAEAEDLAKYMNMEIHDVKSIEIFVKWKEEDVKGKSYIIIATDFSPLRLVK